MEDVTVTIHHHFHFPSEPGQGKILEAIREVKEQVMNLNDTIAELTADDDELAADVNALVSIINDIPNRVQAAVAGSLTNAGVADDHIRTALNAVDSTVKDAIAAAMTALPPTSPPTGQDSVVGTDTGASTLTGGQGNDSIGTDTGNAASGTDSLAGGQASDAVSGGGVPPTSDANSAQTDPATGAVVPPPSASSPT